MLGWRLFTITQLLSAHDVINPGAKRNEVGIDTRFPLFGASKAPTYCSNQYERSIFPANKWTSAVTLATVNPSFIIACAEHAWCYLFLSVQFLTSLLINNRNPSDTQLIGRSTRLSDSAPPGDKAQGSSIKILPRAWQTYRTYGFIIIIRYTWSKFKHRKVVIHCCTTVVRVYANLGNVWNKKEGILKNLATARGFGNDSIAIKRNSSFLINLVPRVRNSGPH